MKLLMFALLFRSALYATEIDTLEHNLATLIPGHENCLYEAPDPDKENSFHSTSLTSPRVEIKEHTLILTSTLPEKRLLNHTLYEYYPLSLSEEQYHLFAYFDLVDQEDEIAVYNLSLAIFLRSESGNLSPYVYYMENKIDFKPSHLKINEFWRSGVHLKFLGDLLVKEDVPSLPPLEFRTPLGDLAKINMYFK